MSTKYGKKRWAFLGPAMVLFILWLLLSGKFETKLLLMGFFASIIVSYLCMPLFMIRRRNDKEGEGEIFALDLNYIKLFGYFFWLLKEVFKAGIHVVGIICRQKRDNVPRIVYFSMPYQNPMASILLANSIILTPGTITLDVSDDGIFEVHAIDEPMAADLLTGDMALRVGALFGEECSFTPLPDLERTYIPTPEAQ